jgi:hypothetical protein
MPAESLPHGAPGRVDPEAFRAAVERAGLGSLPEDDLSRLRHLYDGWRAQVGRLREVLEPGDEPATVFVAAPGGAAAGRQTEPEAGR